MRPVQPTTCSTVADRWVPFFVWKHSRKQTFKNQQMDVWKMMFLFQSESIFSFHVSFLGEYIYVWSTQFSNVLETFKDGLRYYWLCRSWWNHLQGRLAMEFGYYSLAMAFVSFPGVVNDSFSWLYWSTGDASSQSPLETLSRTVLPYQMQMFAVIAGVLTWIVELILDPFWMGILYRMGIQCWYFYRYSNIIGGGIHHFLLP